jgi:4-methylaminobutanoate oxidase (formaldehyde-forming)
MSEHKHIVIIGGGAIGLGIAYHLGKLGIEDVLLLERHRLTSGTSWHAAGIVGPLRSSMNLTELAKYGVELFAELERETGQATGYRQTGGVWLAQKPSRMEELKRIRAMGERSGLGTEILSPEQIAARIPELRIDDLAGGLWVEEDGQVNPVDLCMAYARAAKSHGVEIREQARVTGIERRDGAVAAVVLANGDSIECDKLVIAAGAWSRQLGALAGVNIPLAACEHMYVVSDVIDGLSDPFPIVRDLDSGIYLKGDSGKLVLGAFEASPKAWRPQAGDSEFLMFDADWDHAQPMLEAGIHRSPLMADQGIAHFMNGPESFTPDTRQIMGEAPECTNLFVAAGFNSIGIMSSAGVGRVMAAWIRDKQAPMDLWEVDIARFDPLQDDDSYLQARLPEAVFNQFDMHWPYKQFETGRDLRRSPWHERMAQLGAVFGAPIGWERPLWFARDKAEREWCYSYGAQDWWPMAAREARHCRDAVSLFELSAFSKFEITGQDSLAFLQRLCCSDVDIESGRIRYTLMLNPRGGIEAEVTVARLGEQRFRMVGGAATRFRDLHWLQWHIRDGEAVRIEDVTESEAVVGIMGPNSRALLQALCDTDFSDAAFPFSHALEIEIDGADVLAARLSYVGELGWELYIPATAASDVLGRIIEAGRDHDLGMAGHFALDGCRLEVGFRHWGHDMGPEDSPFECGLGFAVNLRKPTDFLGRRALESQDCSVARRSMLCEVAAEDVLLLHDEPVYRGAEIVGHCTSGGQGFRTGKTLCFAMIDGYDAGAAYELAVAGIRYPLEVLSKAPYRAEVR